MLKDILKKMNDDGYFSRALMAKELGLSEQVLEDALGRLQGMGDLLKEETGQGCVTACAGCPMAKSCAKDIVPMYRISEKGKALLGHD